ncbi:MAG: Na+/H+ antiporter NhaB, partial [Bacillariaceae sp.]|jgi:hypothetical protein
VVKTSVAVAFVSVYELLNYKNERKQDEYNKKSDKKLRPVYKKDLEEGYQRWDVTTTTTSK